MAGRKGLKGRSMKERRASQKLSSKAVMDPNQNVKCKIVVVGDSQCGKTALLHVFAKDCFPEVSGTGPGSTPGAGRGAAPGAPGWGWAAAPGWVGDRLRLQARV